MELKILKVVSKIEWEEHFQNYNYDFIENAKGVFRYFRNLVVSNRTVFTIPPASSLKDISQSLESRTISENSLFFQRKNKYYSLRLK